MLKKQESVTKLKVNTYWERYWTLIYSKPQRSILIQLQFETISLTNTGMQATRRSEMNRSLLAILAM